MTCTPSPIYRRNDSFAHVRNIKLIQDKDLRCAHPSDTAPRMYKVMQALYDNGLAAISPDHASLCLGDGRPGYGLSTAPWRNLPERTLGGVRALIPLISPSLRLVRLSGRPPYDSCRILHD